MESIFGSSDYIIKFIVCYVRFTYIQCIVETTPFQVFPMMREDSLETPYVNKRYPRHDQLNKNDTILFLKMDFTPPSLNQEKHST